MYVNSKMDVINCTDVCKRLHATLLLVWSLPDSSIGNGI